MNIIREFIRSFDPYYIPAAIICITIHECAHGYIAYRLGDPTARMSGRLTLNPIRHIDPIGFLMLVFAGFGWAKPVPVDSRYFKRPRRDIALTSLAGPVSNFILSFFLLLILSAMLRIFPFGKAMSIVVNLLWKTAVISTGLGLFNLLPVSPLDGSKILFSFLPDRIYYTILRYERYGFIVLIALVYLGDFTGLLVTARNWVLQMMLRATGFPFAAFQ